MKPSVYIILVNYNGYMDTVQCIQSLLNIKYDNFKIVLVENASDDADNIRNDQFINDNVKVFFADENGGFSYGNNIGISYALDSNADYVLLLNNDTTVDPFFLDELVKTIQSDSSIGIVTGDIFYWKEPSQLWYSCGNYNRETSIVTMCVPCEEETKDVNFICGCLALLSCTMIKDIGLLDDSFFMYSEDTEYGCRAMDHGWRLVWTNKAKIYHKISASTVDNSAFQSYYLIRNNLYMAKKYSKSPMKAYGLYLFKKFKSALRGHVSMRGLIWGGIDFCLGKTGKSSRF